MHTPRHGLTLALMTKKLTVGPTSAVTVRAHLLEVRNGRHTDFTPARVELGRDRHRFSFACEPDLAPKLAWLPPGTPVELGLRLVPKGADIWMIVIEDFAHGDLWPPLPPMDRS